MCSTIMPYDDRMGSGESTEQCVNVYPALLNFTLDGLPSHRFSRAWHRAAHGCAGVMFIFNILGVISPREFECSRVKLPYLAGGWGGARSVDESFGAPKLQPRRPSSCSKNVLIIPTEFGCFGSAMILRFFSSSISSFAFPHEKRSQDRRDWESARENAERITIKNLKRKRSTRRMNEE